MHPREIKTFLWALNTKLIFSHKQRNPFDSTDGGQQFCDERKMISSQR